MLLAPGEDVSESAGMFLTALRDIGRARRAPWIVWKDVPDDHLHCISGPARERGFFTLPALPDTVPDLPDTTFDGFVAALPGKPRRNTRAKLRRFAASGMRMESARDIEPIAAELLLRGPLRAPKRPRPTGRTGNILNLSWPRDCSYRDQMTSDGTETLNQTR